jgi:peptidyl-tRNA hydrolase
MSVVDDHYDGPPVADEDVVAVYVVLNGTLGMSAGKVAAQAFHGGYGAYREAFHVRETTVEPGLWAEWALQSRRVIVRVAETPHVFQRVQEECLGFTQRDAGLTEVPAGSETAFVTIPYRRADAPKILSHKRVQLYRGFEPGSVPERV